MTFFHASQIKGIQVLEPRISNHNLPLIYFSGKRENVLVYLSNAVEKTCKEKNFQYTGIWHKWGSYGFTQDGRLQYEEYYPNALADTYKGVSGYIYSCNHLEKCEKGNIGIPDVYVSSVPVKVDFCEYIEDAYTELLLAEEKGLIKIVRYEKFTVESVASTGGQIMPPIMGAAAFIMAEMTGYEYSDIIVRAILPAFLYFLGIFLGVHFKAKKLGLVGLKREELPKWKLLLPKIYLLLPLIILTWMVIAGQTMAKSAIYGTIVAIVVGIINKDDRMTPTKFVNGLENGGKNCLSIGIACGIAGIISVCITMTGLGGKLITYVVKLSNGHLFIALFLTMICCIILGMGVPTTANYIIMASTCAPILINGMGMHILAANMFVFYFGIVADITPPVALAAYAGAAIAKAPPMKTALNATRLAIAAFIIPYIFAYNNAMIFVGDVTFLGVTSIVISATLGMASIASGFMGYLIHDLKWYSRIALIAGGLLMVIPGTVTDLAGLAILIVILLIQRAENKKEKKAAV